MNIFSWIARLHGMGAYWVSQEAERQLQAAMAAAGGSSGYQSPAGYFDFEFTPDLRRVRVGGEMSGYAVGEFISVCTEQQITPMIVLGQDEPLPQDVPDWLAEDLEVARVHDLWWMPDMQALQEHLMDPDRCLREEWEALLSGHGGDHKCNRIDVDGRPHEMDFWTQRYRPAVEAWMRTPRGKTWSASLPSKASMIDSVLFVALWDVQNPTQHEWVIDTCPFTGVRLEANENGQHRWVGLGFCTTVEQVDESGRLRRRYIREK